MPQHRTTLLLSLCLFFCFSTSAQSPIVPAPVEYATGSGSVKLAYPVVIITEGNEEEKNQFNAAFLEQELIRLNIPVIRVTGQFPVTTTVNRSKIVLRAFADSTTEAYQAESLTNTITISGSARSIFYGIQSLLQILPETKNPDGLIIPTFVLNDAPRFAYRGMHLDVARHFFTVKEVKKYIDYLAFHKFNTFHWHLTDDQGWRIEIKKYPALTAVGGQRAGTIIGRYPGTGNDNIPYGGFFTQEEIKEVVKYAAQRYISIIPEIELPGHASAAIAAYPELSCFPIESTVIPPNMISAASKSAGGKRVQETWGVFEDVFCPTEYTFSFMQDVLDEVTALFPSQYIHIGGDECPKESWKRSAFCQQLIKDKGLKDEHGLQSYFIRRIEQYLNSKGRKIIGWDEILEGGLVPNATVMSWRGEEGGIAAAQQKHTVVMTPGSHCYFDHTQSANEDSVTIGGYTPLEKVYAYEPIPTALKDDEAKYIMGAQANLWTEYIGNMAKVEYMIFPRMSALAEVLWTPKANRNWAAFEKKIPGLLRQYRSWNANYSKAYFDLNATIKPTKNYLGVIWNVNSKFNNLSAVFTDAKGKRTRIKTLAQDGHTAIIGNTGTYTLQVAPSDKLPLTEQDPAMQASISQSFFFNKATGRKITLTNPPSAKYSGNGAFTLVDGVQNTRGFARSSEFLGFEGKDCEAIIDLGKVVAVNKVIVHALRQPSNWIWQPLSASVSISNDNRSFREIKLSDDFTGGDAGNGIMMIDLKKVKARYIKVVVKHWGAIPNGNPGAGNNAWLFVDEIEVQ